MSDELVSGTVIGDDGDVVGGRVKLGANGTWKSLSSTVKLRTDEGHEVELVEIVKATIDPVVTKKADWQDVEREAGASLFVDEAPAPDVGVELFSGLVRGGARIAAWGAVREHVLEGEGSGGAYREGAKRRVVVMAPSMVFVGDDCVERLERLRATPAHVPLRPPPVVEKRVEPETPWREVRAIPIGLWAAIPCALVFGFLMTRGGSNAWLAATACAGALLLPLAMETIGLAFHVGARKASDWTVKDAAVGYVLLYLGTCALAAYGYAKPDEKPAVWTSLVALMVAGLGVGIVLATRQRRRFVRLIASAKAHDVPIRDGVWGALDGYAHLHAGGADVGGFDVIAKHGVKSSGEEREYEIGAAAEITVGEVIVRFSDAVWLSTVSIIVESKYGRMAVDTIRDGASVRVVGRAKDGVIAKGGEESLLIFATDTDGDARLRVRKLAMWDAVELGLSIAGLLVLVATMFGALSLV